MLVDALAPMPIVTDVGVNVTESPVGRFWNVNVTVPEKPN